MAQLVYRDAMVQNLAGQQVGEGIDITKICDYPRTAQVSTLTVDTATNDHVYTFSLDNVLDSYTADASATKPEITAGIKAAIEANPLMSGKVTVVDDETDTLTLTATHGGTAFTLASDDALLTIATTTANDEADPVPFGVLVIRGSDDNKAFLVNSAELTAKVVHVTPVEVNDATYFLDVTVLGKTYKAAYLADASATVKEIVEGLAAIINAQLPASTVVVTEDDTKLILTAEVKGLDFQVAAGSNSATATVAIADSVAGPSTDIYSQMVGVTLRTAAQELQSDGTLQYAKNSPMAVRRQGVVVVDTEETIDGGDDVYVGITGSDRGLWRSSAGTTAANWLKLDRSKVKCQRNISSSLCELYVNL